MFIIVFTWPPVVLGITEIEAMSTYDWVVMNKSTQTWKCYNIMGKHRKMNIPEIL